MQFTKQGEMRNPNWSSVEAEIANLLREIPREDPKPRSAEIPDDSAILSDPHSITYRLIRAALVVSGAAVVISIVSPYLAWFAASLTW
jgi:hypothetical protein